MARQNIRKSLRVVVYCRVASDKYLSDSNDQKRAAHEKLRQFAEKLNTQETDWRAVLNVNRLSAFFISEEDILCRQQRSDK